MQHPVVQFFADPRNVGRAPPSSFLSQLCDLSFGSDSPHSDRLLGLTTLKQVLSRDCGLLWTVSPPAERTTCLRRLLVSLQQQGSTPLLCHVAANALWTEGNNSLQQILFPLFPQPNGFPWSLTADAMRCHTRDGESVSVKSTLPLSEYRRRCVPWIQCSVSLLRASCGMCSSLPSGGPMLKCVVRTARGLMELNASFPSAVKSMMDGQNAMSQYASFLAQSLANLARVGLADVASVETAKSTVRMLKCALTDATSLEGEDFAQNVLFSDIAPWESLCGETVALCLRRFDVGKCADLVATLLDTPHWAQRAAMTVEQFGLSGIMEMLATREGLLVASSERLAQARKDPLDWLGDSDGGGLQLHDSPWGYLVLSLGRSPLLGEKVGRAVCNHAGNVVGRRNASIRAAAYSMLALCKVTMLIRLNELADRILVPEAQKCESGEEEDGWVAVTACIELLDAYTSECKTMQQLQFSLMYLSRLACRNDKNGGWLVARVHALMALRTLLEWSKVEPREDALREVVKYASGLCRATCEVFAALFKSDADDDLAQSTMLGLLPLQVNLLQHVPPEHVEPVAKALLQSLVTLWQHLSSPCMMLRTEILHSVSSVCSKVHKQIRSADVCNLFFQPFLAPLAKAAASISPFLASEGLSLVSHAVLMSQPSAQLRSFLLSIAPPSPDAIMNDPSFGTFLDALVHCERSLQDNPSQELFHFSKRVVQAIAADSEPPSMCVSTFVLCMHKLFMSRVNAAVLDDRMLRLLENK